MIELLQRFETSLGPEDKRVVDDAAEYVEWMIGRQDAEFVPSDDDDIDLRAYLLHLRVSGVQRGQMRLKFASLKRFYRWTTEEGLIDTDPFAGDDFERPFLDRDEIRRRKAILPADAEKRELTYLRALHELTQQLNRSTNVRAALEMALETLAGAMSPHTAWMYVVPDIYYHFAVASDRLPHDFALAAGYGLPPGLQRDDRCFLSQPPDCRCQELARRAACDVPLMWPNAPVYRILPELMAIIAACFFTPQHR